MNIRARVFAAVLSCGIGGWASHAEASSVPPPQSVADPAMPAFRYADMADEEALRELSSRGIVFERLEGVPGVRAPVRLATRLHGVLIRSSLPMEDRADSKFEILDARLALALDDFTALLESHDVVELVHYTMYRPNGPKPRPQDRARGLLDGKGLPASPLKPAKGKDGEALGKDGVEAPAEPAPKSDANEAPAGQQQSAKKATSKKAKKASVEDGRKDKKSSKTASKSKSKTSSKSKTKGAKSDGAKTASKTKGAKSDGNSRPELVGAEVSETVAVAQTSTETPRSDEAPRGFEEPVAAKPTRVDSPSAKPESAPEADPSPTATAQDDFVDSDAAVEPSKSAGRRKRHAKHGKAHEGRRAKRAKNAKNSKKSSKSKSSPNKKSAPRKADPKETAPKKKRASTRDDDAHEESSAALSDSLSDSGLLVRKVAYSPPGTRHPAGLAIDVGSLRKSDGQVLSIASHFGGHIGATTCGPDARMPSTAAGRELWTIVCEAKDAGIFSHVLTPNFDAAHADHFHMEIKPGARLQFYR